MKADSSHYCEKNESLIGAEKIHRSAAKNTFIVEKDSNKTIQFDQEIFFESCEDRNFESNSEKSYKGILLLNKFFFLLPFNFFLLLFFHPTYSLR